MVDFDQIGYQKVGGGMMGSPSSTAAYLMHSSSWNKDAEEYLSTVVASNQKSEAGGVPSAFTAINFMLSWVRTYR